MKICPSCGAQWNNQLQCCGDCGTPLNFVPDPTPQTPPQVYSSGTAQPASSQPVIIPGPSMMPNNPTNPSMPPKKPTTPFSPKSKKATLFMILGLALGFVAIVVILGLLTNWFGLVSPIQGLIKATSRTLNSKSVTVNMTVNASSGSYESTLEREYRVILDREERELSYFMDSSREDDDGYRSQERTYFHNGTTYNYYETEWDGDEGYSFASSYENDEFEDSFFDEAEDVINEKNEINWKSLLRKAGLEDYLEHEEIEPFLRTVYKEYLCSGKWLKETAGFERKGNVYTFRPDLDDLGNDVIDICKDSDAFSRKAKRNIEEYVEDLMDSADRANLELEISCTVKGGKLVKIEVIAETKDDDYEITLEFTEIGKTEIDDGDVKELKRDVREWEEEHTCESCGDTYATYEYDGMTLCWDCYYDMSYRYRYTCDFCDEGMDTYYTYYGYWLCWDCYYEYAYD